MIIKRVKKNLRLKLIVVNINRIPTWLIITIGILCMVSVGVLASYDKDKKDVVKQYIDSQTKINNSEMSYEVTYDRHKNTISHIAVIKTKHLSPAFKNTLITQYSNNNTRNSITPFEYYTDKEVVKRLAKAKIKIRFYTTTDDGYVLEDVTYSSDEYTNPITKVELIRHVESGLEKQATSLSVRLPIKVDDGFYLTNVSYDTTTKYITYFITVNDNILRHEKSSNLSEYCSVILDFMASEFIETIRTGDNYEDAIGEILDLYEELGVTIRMAMIDNRGNVICFKDRRLTKNTFYYE